MLFYYTAVVQTDVNKLSPNPDVTVFVNPFKWNWTFAYPSTLGPDQLPVATVGSSDYIPVLVLPTNKRIRFVEHSPDVIHSFWVPALLFKRDVFPGNVVNQFETTLLTPGSYVGRCAELCGTYHSMMNFELRAVTPEKFQAFLAAKQRRHHSRGARVDRRGTVRHHDLAVPDQAQRDRLRLTMRTEYKIFGW